MKLGLPLSGSSGKVYGGITPFLLWEAAVAAGYRRNVWYTEAAIERRGLALPAAARRVELTGRLLVNVDEVPGIEALTPGLASAEARVRRVQRLVRFIDPSLRSGDRARYVREDDTVELPAASSFPKADDYALAALAALIAWTGGPGRLERDTSTAEAERFEALVVELATWLAAAWLQLHGAFTPVQDELALWGPAVVASPDLLGRAAGVAQQALAYLQALSPGDLHADREVPTRRGTATALGELLELSFDEVGRGRFGEEQLVLTLPRPPAQALQTFLSDLAGRGRRNPTPAALLTGASGSGATQVVVALSEVLLTGGVDLDGALLQGDGDEGALLDAVGSVWTLDQVVVVPTTLGVPLSLPPDRMIPTACLSAFYAYHGRASTLWVARLEEVLERNGTFAEFASTYQALSGRRWLGGANHDVVVDQDRIIEALGGDPEDPEDEETRRVRWYASHKANATWAGLREEVEGALYAQARRVANEHGGEVPEDPPPRALFVVDLGPALLARGDEAERWRRKLLRVLVQQVSDLADAGEVATWFLFCAERPKFEIAEAGGWTLEERRLLRTHVALERHPVHGAFRQELLAKNLDECSGLYRMFADNRDMFEHLAVLDDWPCGVKGGRDELVDAFPFLPGLIPLAQAVLDTFVREGDAEQRPMPLAELVDRALDEHFYGPPDRFVPLDVLFEPLLRRLDFETEDDTAEARSPLAIFVPGAVTRASGPQRPRTFPDESILSALRLAGRVHGLPCTPANLVRLMFVRVDGTWEELVDEVRDALVELKARGFVSSPDNVHYRFVKAR